MTTDNVKTTSLALVNPNTDVAFIAIGEQVMGLVRYAESRTIANLADMMATTDDLSLIAKLKKALEDKRKEYVQPFNEHVKEVNGIFKLIGDPLERADNLNKSKVLAYRAEIERKRREAEAIEAEKLALAKREAELSGTGAFTVDLSPVDKPAPPPDRVHTEMGTLSKSGIWKWEQIDWDLVPKEYKMLNEVLIGKVVRSGMRTIPGLRIYQEETLRISSK